MTTTRMAKRQDRSPRQATTERRDALLALIRADLPMTVRSAYYLAATHLSHLQTVVGTVAYAKNDAGYGNVGDDLSWLRDNDVLDYEAILDGSGRDFDAHLVMDRQQALKVAKDLISADPWKGAEYRVAFAFETAAMWRTYQRRLSDLRPSGIGLGGNGRMGAIKALSDWLALAPDEEGIVLYVGDLDGQGMDISLDLSNRLFRHARRAGHRPPEVLRVALTEEVVEAFKVISHPPALSKTGAAKALDRKYGFTTETWEAEALPPADMERLLRDAFEGVAPDDWDKRIEQAKADEEEMREGL